MQLRSVWFIAKGNAIKFVEVLSRHVHEFNTDTWFVSVCKIMGARPLHHAVHISLQLLNVHKYRPCAASELLHPVVVQSDISTEDCCCCCWRWCKWRHCCSSWASSAQLHQLSLGNKVCILPLSASLYARRAYYCVHFGLSQRCFFQLWLPRLEWICMKTGI